ncbi:MAG: ABC transporter substrate-binding protein [Opitutaceae bacterium]|jgi:NitT/TauT family transport system substrate-binding protein
MTHRPENTLGRRRFLKTSAAALAAFTPFNILRAQSAASTGVNTPVRVGYLPITDSAPLLIAHARGLYEAEGLTAERPALFRSWAQIVEAFVAGQVNVVHLLSPITLTLRYGRAFPAKVVAWNHTNGSALTILPELAGVHDLAGRTVAVPSWYSIHNVVVQELLRKEGLRYSLKPDGTAASDEVKLVTLAPSDMISALANKSIGGFIVAEPFNASAEIKGIGKIARFTGDVWENHACCVVLVREDAIVENREWVQRVTNAVVKAQQWSNANRPEVARILSRESGLGYTPHPEAVVDRVLTESGKEAYVASGAIRHPEWHDPRIGFQPYPYASYTEELVRRVQGTQVAGDRAFLDKLDPAFVSRDLVDDSFVRTALREIGGPSAFSLDPALTRTERIAV